MSDQELWVRLFIAALEGAATSTNGWAGDRCEYLLNRAHSLADRGVERIKNQRAALARLAAAKEPRPPTVTLDETNLGLPRWGQGRATRGRKKAKR